MATTNPYRFTETDKPPETLRTFWTLGTGKAARELSMNVTAPVQAVVNYLRDAMDETVGEVSAGWAFLEGVMPADDYEALNTWPMTYDQFQQVGRRAFSMLVHEGNVDDKDKDSGG